MNSWMGSKARPVPPVRLCCSHGVGWTFVNIAMIFYWNGFRRRGLLWFNWCIGVTRSWQCLPAFYSHPQEELHIYIILQFYRVRGKSWKALPWAGHANTPVESQQSSSTKTISIEDHSNISKSPSCRRQHHDCNTNILQSWCCRRQDRLFNTNHITSNTNHIKCLIEDPSNISKGPSCRRQHPDCNTNILQHHPNTPR